MASCTATGWKFIVPDELILMQNETHDDVVISTVHLTDFRIPTILIFNVLFMSHASVIGNMPIKKQITNPL